MNSGGSSTGGAYQLTATFTRASTGISYYIRNGAVYNSSGAVVSSSVSGIDFEPENSTSDNWVLRFLVSGIFSVQIAKSNSIDVFCVGGGGGGTHGGGGSAFSSLGRGGHGYSTSSGSYPQSFSISTNYGIGVGSGGAANTDTATYNTSVFAGTGGTSSAFGISASGGSGGEQYYTYFEDLDWWLCASDGDGGTANVYEFFDSSTGKQYCTSKTAVANSGNGAAQASAGSSGIVCIRNAR